MVGAVGELASMKRCKLLGEDGLCCSSSAAQTRLGPSSLLGERSKTPIVFVVSFVSSATPQIGGTAKVYKKKYPQNTQEGSTFPAKFKNRATERQSVSPGARN